jgi:hypothetical protein
MLSITHHTRKRSSTGPRTTYGSQPEKPQVPVVDLKPLPKGLKYVFLGLDKTYLIIVSDKLCFEENKKLLNLLKKHRKVIGYSINDLNALSLAFCTHRIPMEVQCKC